MMLHIRWFLCVLLTMIVSNCSHIENPTQIIENALEAHGGIRKWQNIKEITYHKTTILYDSLGKEEKRIVQKHYNMFYPNFVAEMSWKEDTVSKRVVYKNDSTSVFVGNTFLDDNRLKKKYTKEILAANYVFWQPYKLYKDRAKLFFEGKQTIQGRDVKVIKVEYFNEDTSPSNTWWYYFDVLTNRLVGNTVHHGNTYSYIENSKYENRTGLLLNAERKSYRIDSLVNIKFLRAHYFYEIIDVK